MANRRNEAAALSSQLSDRKVLPFPHQSPYSANTAALAVAKTRLEFFGHAALDEYLDEFRRPRKKDGDDMAASDDLTDAKIARSAAEAETKLTRLEGKIDTLMATIVGKLDAANEKMSADHEYNRTTRWVMVGLAIALAGLIVTLATYGDAMFGRGMNVRDVVQTVLKESATQATKEAPKPSK
jgi:hypothetical protein